MKQLSNQKSIRIMEKISNYSLLGFHISSLEDKFCADELQDIYFHHFMVSITLSSILNVNNQNVNFDKVLITVPNKINHTV